MPLLTMAIVRPDDESLVIDGDDWQQVAEPLLRRSIGCGLKRLGEDEFELYFGTQERKYL